jgi:hypothetical protein
MQQETNLDADSDVLPSRVSVLRDHPKAIIDDFAKRGVWQGDFVTPADRRHHQWSSQ